MYTVYIYIYVYDRRTIDQQGKAQMQYIYICMYEIFKLEYIDTYIHIAFVGPTIEKK